MATVTAPGSVLDHLKSINLGEIDVTGASSDVTVQLPVPLPEGDLRAADGFGDRARDGGGMTGA